jgi:hypothetical protein
MGDAVNTLVIVVWVVTGICWLMTLYKLRDLARDPHNLPLRALCLALVGITLSLTAQRLAYEIDHFVGALDFGRVTADCLAVVAGAGGQAFLLYMTSQDERVRRQVRRRNITVAVCVVAIMVLYAVTPPRYAIDDPYVLSRVYYLKSNAPLIAPYVFVHLTYIGWAAVQIAVLARRYTRIATRPLLRLGLRLMAAGALVGLAYVVIKFVNMAIWPLTGRVPGLAASVIVVTFSLSILLMLVGATIPSWGPLLGLDRLANWAAALRAYRRLAPLWTALHRVNPTIALLPPPTGLSAPILVARRARLRLVRRVVEIRDGYLALRPYADAKADRIARRLGSNAGLSGDDIDGVAEAAVVAAALRYRERGQTPVDPSPLLASSPAGRKPGGADPRDPAVEVAWLARVACAYRSSPLVAATLAELDAVGATDPVASAAPAARIGMPDSPPPGGSS